MSYKSIISAHKFVIFGTEFCPFSAKAQDLLEPLVKPDQLNIIDVDEHPDGDTIKADILRDFKHKTVPAIFIDQKFIGGFTELNQHIKENPLDEI